MSRITYTNGKLYLSLTRSECEEAYKNIGRPVELDIGNIKVLHEDISKAVSEYIGDYWSIELNEELVLSYLKGKNATQSK
jgi:hypothetical protein